MSRLVPRSARRRNGALRSLLRTSGTDVHFVVLAAVVVIVLAAAVVVVTVVVIVVADIYFQLMQRCDWVLLNKTYPTHIKTIVN